MSEDEKSRIVKSRLNSLLRDASEAEKHVGSGIGYAAGVIKEELIELVDFINKNLPESDLPDIQLERSLGTLGDRGYMQYVKTNIRKVSDFMNINLELDNPKQEDKTVFNVIQSQNVTQNNLQVFENMISNINQFDIDIESKKEILNLTNKFKEESEKEKPNSGKLKEIFNSIFNKSKEAAAMLSYWATITGAINLLLD